MPVASSDELASSGKFSTSVVVGRDPITAVTYSAETNKAAVLVPQSPRRRRRRLTEPT
jgi:hypothetical protein